MLAIDPDFLWSLIARVGRGPALLFLCLRAIEARGRPLKLSQHDQPLETVGRWLALPRWRLALWLDRLRRARVLWYADSVADRTLTLEFFPVAPNVATMTDPTRARPLLEIPTLIFFDWLPLVQRSAFLVYLYLRSLEAPTHPSTNLSWTALVKNLRLLGRGHAFLLVARLWWHRLLRLRLRPFEILLSDPPMLSHWQRFRVRHLGRWARHWWTFLVFCLVAYLFLIRLLKNFSF